MTPEQHLAAILTAFNETDGYNITVAMYEALRAAEQDFDGVEDMLERNRKAIDDELNDPSNRITFRRELRSYDDCMYG